MCLAEPIVSCCDFTINAGAAKELGHPLSGQGSCGEDPFRGQSEIISFWHVPGIWGIPPFKWFKHTPILYVNLQNWVAVRKQNVWALLRVYFWDVNSSLRPWFVLTIVSFHVGDHTTMVELDSVRLLVASHTVYILPWWCQLTWIHRTHFNQY